jgi:quercetin dioxygenase-like cupin family protein
MTEEILLDRGTMRVRRLRLEPGEAMPWHVDPFYRVTVVLKGNSLTIEGRDGGTTNVKVTPGQVDWDEPSERPHRGINSGTTLYEEVTIFILDRPGDPHQPPA